ncbi:MAG: hypothetical protein AABP62_05620 [Planctomycetota bacterium]
MYRKPWSVVLLAVCCAISPDVSLAEDAPSPAEIREAEADIPWHSLRFGFDAEQKVLDALRVKITANWQKKPLADVLDEFKKATAIPFEVDAESLENGEIASAPDITLDLGETTVLFALKRLCSDLNVTWNVEYGVVRLLSRTMDSERLITRVYDVSKLTKWLTQNGLEKLTDAEILAVAEALRPNFGQLAEDKKEPPLGILLHRGPHRELVAEQLLASFIPDCSSGKWEVSDAEGGTINFWSQRLVVYQTFQVHLEVAGLLKSLEQLMLGEGTPASTKFPALHDPVEEEAALEAVLKKKVSVRVDKVPLRQVMADLAKEHGFRYSFDEEALASEGLEAANPLLTKDVRDVSLRIALRLMLGPHDLTWVNQDGWLIITVPVRGEEKHQTIGYRIDKIPHAANRPAFLELIMSQTSGTWEVVDGEGGSLSWLGPKILIVTQASRIHEELVALFDQLKKDPLAHVAPFDFAVPNADRESKLYKLKSPREAKDILKALPLVLRDPSQVSKSGRIGEHLIIEAPPASHEEIEVFLKTYRDGKKPDSKPLGGGGGFFSTPADSAK